ncbi:ABC transporter substrate-binding protein [Thermodesulfobacteriota bacterium]
MKKITAVFALALAVLVSAHPASAQQTGKVYRIGTIRPYDRPSPSWNAFLQGLRDIGYIEGQNLMIEYRYGKGRKERVPNLVNELVQQKVDVIFVTNQVAIRAAKKATKTIPIVMLSSIDPVAAGLVYSLTHPGGNITGLTRLKGALSAKRMELLKEVVPKMSRIAILWNPGGPGSIASFKESEVAARAFKLDLQSLEVRGPNPDYENAFQAAKKGCSDALIIVSSPPNITPHRKRIMRLVTRDRLPSMTPGPRWVEDGGLMSYQADTIDEYRRAATYIDKILKGTKPADLPVERAMKFLLHVNLKIAKELGLTIPPEILMNADKVIQ